MFCFRSTPIARFYKDHPQHSFKNPARRWFYHYLFGGAAIFSITYVYALYKFAGLEAKWRSESSGYFVASPGFTDFLYLLPFNRVSNRLGSLTEPGILPPSVHRLCIDWLAWWYGVDLGECVQSEFASVQDFYTRMWKPEARPVDPTASFVAPCDGVLLSIADNVTSSSLVQVKGITYSIQSLLRVQPSVEVPYGYKRVALAIHLRVGDFHHVIAPTGFCCSGSVYVPGTLFPATWEGYHYLPGVLNMNERLVVHGTVESTTQADKMSKGTFWGKKDHLLQSEAPFFGMALVGSTLTGKIKLCIDNRIRTNFLDPPDYAVHTNYSSSPFMQRGSPVGYFKWGSTVVVVADVPKDAQLVRKVADVVKAGEPLFR